MNYLDNLYPIDIELKEIEEQSREYLEFDIVAIGGPSDSAQEAYSEAQSDFDSQLSAITSYLESNSGEVTGSDNSVEETWEEGETPEIKHFSKLVSRVIGYIEVEEYSLLTSNRKSTLLLEKFPKLGTIYVDAPMEVLQRSVPDLKKSFIHNSGGLFINPLGWKYIGGDIVCDFSKGKELPSEVKTISREFDNRNATTSFNWRFKLSESITETQTIKISKTVKDTSGFKVGIKYLGLSVGGDVKREITANTSRVSTTTRIHKEEEDFSSTVPAGVLRKVVFHIVKGNLSVPMIGNIIIDVEALGRLKSGKDIHFFFKDYVAEKFRSFDINGNCVFGSFSKLTKTITDVENGEIINQEVTSVDIKG